MKKQQILILGLVGVGIGIYFVATNKKDDPNTEAQPLVETQPQTTTPTIKLDKNLVLKLGSKGNEVAELQRLLGITRDGIFGNQTEKALIDKKGLKQITLNYFAIKQNAPVFPISVGDTVEANKVVVTVYKNQKDGSNFTNTGQVEDTFFYGQNIGKVISITSDKKFLVVNEKNTFLPDRILWVKSDDVNKV